MGNMPFHQTRLDIDIWPTPMPAATAERAMKPRSRIRVCVAFFFAMTLAGCAAGEAIIAADHTRCRSLGFVPNTVDYEVCLAQVQRERTTLAAVPEQLRDR